MSLRPPNLDARLPAAALLLTLCFVGPEPERIQMGTWAVPRVAPPAGPRAAPPEACDVPDEDQRAFVFPTGVLPSLACDDARTITKQARDLRAVPAEPVDGARFATSTSDWLDPHGFWSVAPDAPIAHSIKARAAKLLHEIEAAPGSGACDEAEALGAELAAWVGAQRTVMQEARSAGNLLVAGAPARLEAIRATPFEDGMATRPAATLSRLIGHSLGVAERTLGDDIEPHCEAAVDRMAPDMSPHAWSEVLLAAALRAYLPQIDPHGAWAPLDEESSIYDVDLEVDPPLRLWSEMTRTALGVRIDQDAMPPLRDGDIVIRVGGVTLSGLSIEQSNQLSLLFDAPRAVEVIRGAHVLPLVVTPTPIEPGDPDDAVTDAPSLEISHIDYADGEALVVHIPDVPDDLGDEMLGAIASSKEPPVGILIDLRGNGGGSTDGALALLGLFLPGAPLFPLRRRDGTIEVDRAPRVSEEDRWSGPVAALVDGESASAAEMIAGAFAAYDRGPVVGARTYGKGCAQEYIEDATGRGVLRLTTLLFSLPDGSPLQQVGVTPDVALGLPASRDREATLNQAPSTWEGPDVRDKAMIGGPAWPEHGGKIGMGADANVYRALRALGATRAAKR